MNKQFKKFLIANYDRNPNLFKGFHLVSGSITASAYGTDAQLEQVTSYVYLTLFDALDEKIKVAKGLESSYDKESAKELKKLKDEYDTILKQKICYETNLDNLTKKEKQLKIQLKGIKNFSNNKTNINIANLLTKQKIAEQLIEELNIDINLLTQKIQAIKNKENGKKYNFDERKLKHIKNNKIKTSEDINYLETTIKTYQNTIEKHNRTIKKIQTSLVPEYKEQAKQEIKLNEYNKIFDELDTTQTDLALLIKENKNKYSYIRFLRQEIEKREKTLDIKSTDLDDLQNIKNIIENDSKKTSNTVIKNFVSAVNVPTSGAVFNSKKSDFSLNEKMIFLDTCLDFLMKAPLWHNKDFMGWKENPLRSFSLIMYSMFLNVAKKAMSNHQKDKKFNVKLDFAEDDSKNPIELVDDVYDNNGKENAQHDPFEQSAQKELFNELKKVLNSSSVINELALQAIDIIKEVHLKSPLTGYVSKNNYDKTKAIKKTSKVIEKTISFIDVSMINGMKKSTALITRIQTLIGGNREYYYDAKIIISLIGNKMCSLLLLVIEEEKRLFIKESKGHIYNQKNYNNKINSYDGGIKLLTKTKKEYIKQLKEFNSSVTVASEFVSPKEFVDSIKISACNGLENRIDRLLGLGGGDNSGQYNVSRQSGPRSVSNTMTTARINKIAHKMARNYHIAAKILNKF